MKGVSARLDENAGVRPRKDLNSGAASSSSSSRSKKRTRGLSFGSTSELQARNACGIFKKGRVDELRASTRDEGKGKGKATSEGEGLDSEVRSGRGLQAHSSLPDMHSRSDLKRSLSSKDVSFMVVDDDKDDDMDTEHDVSLSAVSSSSDHGYERTLSQTEMPPPPIPYDSVTHKQRQAAADPPSSTLTPLAVSRHSNSINKPQTSYPPPQQPQTNYSVKQRKPDAVPKMHPLLYHKPATTTKVSSSPMVTPAPQVQPQVQPQPQRLSTPVPVSEGANSEPLPSPVTPLISTKPPSRPPALGMRRNRTFPSRTSSSSSLSVSSSLTGNCGQLPQRQKGFKPPLLSSSQPQAGTQPRTRDLSQVKTNTNIIVVEPGSTITTGKKASSQNSLEASSTPTNTSKALRSSTSSSSESSASFQSTISSSTPTCSQSHSSNASDCSKLNKCNQGMVEHVGTEPIDGDPDSSFGDMSFDMDALEETMKMYD